MKKLIVALLAALAMTAGLLVGTTTTASAAQCDRYGVCVKPKPEKPEKDKSVKAGQKPKLKVKMQAPGGGDAKPEGTLKMVIEKVGDSSFRETVEKELNKNGAATLKGPKLAAGEYKITWKFIPKEGTPWERITREYFITVS